MLFQIAVIAGLCILTQEHFHMASSIHTAKRSQSFDPNREACKIFRKVHRKQLQVEEVIDKLKKILKITRSGELKDFIAGTLGTSDFDIVARSF